MVFLVHHPRELTDIVAYEQAGGSSVMCEAAGETLEQEAPLREGPGQPSPRPHSAETG
jgi:hypothetical protein